jgi:hypothetical protein
MSRVAGINAADVNRCSLYSWLDSRATENPATNPTKELSLGWPADLRVAGLVELGGEHSESGRTISLSTQTVSSDDASLNGSFLACEYDIASNCVEISWSNPALGLPWLSVLRSANTSGYYDCRGVRVLWRRGNKVDDYGCEPQSGAGQLASGGTLSALLRTGTRQPYPGPDQAHAGCIQGG